MMRRQIQAANMSQQPGLPGTHPVTMPNRQASTTSAMSDDAVPAQDPKDVRIFGLPNLLFQANLCH
jgi:hypothetical protein